jgi:predicted GH43/DUF377 family glycosyl hydrolase
MNKIFEFRTYLDADNFYLNTGKKIINVSNPAAYLTLGGKLVILPRLGFTEGFKQSSIGITEPLDLNKIEDFENIKTKIIRKPVHEYDVAGVEDARITENGKQLLTVGLNTYYRTSATQTIYSVVSNNKVINNKPFWYNNSIYNTGRDAFILNDNVLIFRPEADNLRSYRANYEITEHYVIIGMGIVPILEPQKVENKTGFSTNSVKISKDENLVAYHALCNNKKAEYAEGFMVLNNAGFPQRKTPLFLKTEGFLQGGDRPFTLFGCGLIKSGKEVYFVGGVGDSGIVIYSADLDKILEVMK